MELCSGGEMVDYLAAQPSLSEATIARTVRAVLQFLAQVRD
jgi:hypothetical protein